ncbi:MAG TPA: ATP-binding protein [Bacteroidales bacterium]|nr:ATP-binding protein [Bacteroidales bacterium]
MLLKRKAKVIRRFDAAKAITMGDAEQLEIVFGNLIDNAVKYSPGQPEITIGIKVDDGSLMVVIADKGFGTNKEYQQEIFREFYRVRTGDGLDVKGFGLGLHYVKTVVETHNGSVSVKSSPGKGSSFEVILPAETN